MKASMTRARLEATWDRQVFPLIQEYLFDRADRLEQFRLESFWPS
jgi:hypothetical protein